MEFGVLFKDLLALNLNVSPVLDVTFVHFCAAFNPFISRNFVSV